jgi:hypothetical protein
MNGDLTEDGGEVLHSWINKCDARISKHSQRTSKYTAIALTNRTLQIIIMATAALVAMVRMLMLGSSVDGYYCAVLSAVSVLIVLGESSSYMDKAVFHKRFLFEMQFLKKRAQWALTTRRSPETIRQEYDDVMTRSSIILSR